MTDANDPKETRLIPTIAYQAGTVNAIDRKKQYARSDAMELLRSLNEAWKTIRLNEAAVRDRDKMIAGLHEKLAERDETIEKQAEYLRDRDLKQWVVRWATRLLIAGQWSIIAWLATTLFSRLAH